MTPELANALAKLALQLGTTADRVFPMLVQKTKFEAALCIWGFGAGAFIGICFIVFLVYALIEWDWDEMTWMTVGITTLFVVIFTIISLGSISDYRYPEAAAIQSLVRGK